MEVIPLTETFSPTLDRLMEETAHLKKQPEAEAVLTPEAIEQQRLASLQAVKAEAERRQRIVGPAAAYTSLK